MELHIDIPTRSELERLVAHRAPGSVSIYLPTTPVTTDADADRIALKNATADAVAQLRAAGIDDESVASIEEQLHHLVEDEVFWAYQAISLAIFVTPERLLTYRLPNRLGATVAVGDRFHIKPLLRTSTFPQAALVLALAGGSVRLLEISPDLPPHELRVPGLPSDVASAVGKTSITDRSPRGAVQGGEGQKLRLRQYARQVDHALRPVLAGQHLPLVLAATQPLDSIYRSVNSYSELMEEPIAGNPETMSDGELAAQARLILDAAYAAEVAATLHQVEELVGGGRAATEISDIARAATFGAIDTLLVDIDAEMPGEIDEVTGVVSYGASPGGAQLTDEIARRALLSRARVLAVRAADLGDHEGAVAILRYAV